VGVFYDGRIYRFVTPLDLLRFSPLPLVDRVRLGLVGLYLRRQKDWRRYEGVTASDWIKRYGRPAQLRSGVGTASAGQVRPAGG